MIDNNPPCFSAAEAQMLAASLYGLDTTATSMPGERDQNFRLASASGEQFVLKIANGSDGKNLLEAQNLAMAKLQAAGLPVQRVLPTTTGSVIALAAHKDGTPYLARLLTYLPGRLWAESRPHNPELLRDLGRVLGAADCALAHFDHPAAHRELRWDLRKSAWIRGYSQYIESPDKRAIVERCLERFERETLPALVGMRSSVIYNDANDYNLLVAGSGGARHISGLLDFGDMVYTQTICDLAIGGAYACLDKPDPLTAAAHVVAGYHTANSLSEDEIGVLFDLIGMRLCVSVTNSAYQRSTAPADPYLTISERPAWAALEVLDTVNPHLAQYTFRHACGLPPSPKSDTLVQWLATHREQVNPVVAGDLHNSAALTFDLGIDSLELGNLGDHSDVAAFTHKLFDKMSAAGATTGIGKYDEARPIYTSEMFRVEGNEGPEFRTVHLGLDLFQNAGAPVFALLDGTVHALRNNAAPLDYGPTIILSHEVDDGRLTFYSLYGHLSADSLDGLRVGMPVEAGTQIAKIGNFPTNGNWPPHLHLQLMTDLLGRDGEFPGVALPSQREIWTSISPDPGVMFGLAPVEKTALSQTEILRLREQHIGRSLSISYQKPLKIVRGSMQYLYDEDGRAFLDAVNNVSHVGHCHPRVVRAGQDQMAVLNTNTRYLHDYLARYAERLCATLPEPLRVCYFVCSGSEANELALRLARTHTHRKDVLVVDVAYHGNTTELIEISPYKHNGPGGAGAPPYVHIVPMPDDYRGPYRRGDGQAGTKYAQHVQGAIAAAQARGSDVAAFICESLLSCGGQIVLPDGFLAESYKHVREAGGVCIADEVQVGFGRVGTAFWGFETQSVVPDIVTMGKPIGNGHPLAAVVTTPEIAASFDNGMEYFNTFGGNPVSCAIGLAVLDVIESEGLQANALETGNHLLAGLQRLMGKYPLVGDVRGLGLFVGIELVRDRETREPAPSHAAYIANRMRDNGILLSTDGPYHNVLKIKPPLVFDSANADFLVRTLDRILGEDDALPKS
jgi:4-aminobutyrate aminotransferase-like enzyme/Ser/Thr protein kinase RdoA (MazF antagonist)